MAIIPKTPSIAGGGVKLMVAKIEQRTEQEQSHHVVHLRPSRRSRRNIGYTPAQMRCIEAQLELYKALQDVEEEELVQLRQKNMPPVVLSAENRYSIMTVSSGYGSRPTSDRYSVISFAESEQDFTYYNEDYERDEEEDDNSSSDYETPPTSPKVTGDN